MGNSRKDFISDLPQSLIETVLTKLPIGDAVRTSILSRNWRYQWATMKQLVFNAECISLSDDSKIPEKELANFIMRFFLLHDGLIHKFKLSTLYCVSSTDMDQWLLFLSRKDIKELDLDVWCEDREFFRTPCMFSCQELTKLKLFMFEVKPSLEFRGFPCLKYLNLYGGTVTLEVIENLISGCPLLEKFKFKNDEALALTVCAPKLKHLTVDGIFKDMYLEHTPFLVDLIIDFFSKDWEGNVLLKFPKTYDCLKVISLGGINFKERNQALYVLHLLLQSPNLQELIISARISRCLTVHHEAADLDFWEKECPTDFTFKHLKMVKMSYLANKDDIKFLKFVLGRSPVLEVMSISPDFFYIQRMDMSCAELLRFQQASPKIEFHLLDQSSYPPPVRAIGLCLEGAGTEKPSVANPGPHSRSHKPDDGTGGRPAEFTSERGIAPPPPPPPALICQL